MLLPLVLLWSLCFADWNICFHLDDPSWVTLTRATFLSTCPIYLDTATCATKKLWGYHRLVISDWHVGGCRGTPQILLSRKPKKHS